MIDETNQQVDEKNRWRLETPGHDGWQRTARPGDSNRHLLISADCHVNEPSKLWWERIDAKFRNRLPHIEVDEKGEQVDGRRGLSAIARPQGLEGRRATGR